MYSRSTDRCEREAVIYRSNLPPRYSGNRFAEAEREGKDGGGGEFGGKSMPVPPRYSGNRFAEAECEDKADGCGECGEECGEREGAPGVGECRAEKCRRHSFSRKRFGNCRLCPPCEQEDDGACGECGGDGRGLSAILPIGLGKEEITLAVILLLIAREGGTDSYEIMVILALLLAVR